MRYRYRERLRKNSAFYAAIPLKKSSNIEY